MQSARSSFFAWAICSLGTTGFTGGLSWGLTAWAYKEYFECMLEHMPIQAIIPNLPSDVY
jgi:hypothetical protein